MDQHQEHSEEDGGVVVVVIVIDVDVDVGVDVDVDVVTVVVVVVVVVVGLVVALSSFLLRVAIAVAAVVVVVVVGGSISSARSSGNRGNQNRHTNASRMGCNSSHTREPTCLLQPIERTSKTWMLMCRLLSWCCEQTNAFD